MAKEVTTAREAGANPLNTSSSPMTRTRQHNAVMNARVQENSGTTRINLGGGNSVAIKVSFINRSSGTIEGRLDLNGSEGRNKFNFGGNSGSSFDEALRKVKRDIVRNI